jgi:HlyD family secretion protein
MTSKWKWLGTAIGLLMTVGLIGLLFVACPWAGKDSPDSDTATRDAQRGEFPAMGVELTTVERGAVSATLELTGNLLPRRRTIVVAEEDGVIQSIPRSPRKIEVEIEGRKYSENLGLDLGQPVAQGDILIQLDPTEYELELASAKSKLHKTQKDLENLLAWKRPEEIRRLKAARQDAVARAERAEADFKRVESLIGQRATSEQEHLRIQSELRSARAAVEGADADLAEGEAGPTETEIAVLRALVSQAEVDVQIKEDRLQKTVIRAPYDAVIVDRFVDVGERVTSQPRVELMELMDLSLVIAQVAVPERYLGRIEIGQFVKVEAAGTVESVPGVIVLVNEKIDHATRTFRVRVAVENHKRAFKAGQFAKVAFGVDSATQALIVPTPAVVYFGGQPQVFVYDSGSQRVAQRPVRIGLAGNGVTEVIDGLAEGERIVLQDPAILADGMRVQPAAARQNAAVEDQKHALTAASAGDNHR